MKVYFAGICRLHPKAQNSLYFKRKGQEKQSSFLIGDMSKYFYAKLIEKKSLSLAIIIIIIIKTTTTIIAHALQSRHYAKCLNTLSHLT